MTVPTAKCISEVIDLTGDDDDDHNNYVPAFHVPLAANGNEARGVHRAVIFGSAGHALPPSTAQNEPPAKRAKLDHQAAFDSSAAVSEYAQAGARQAARKDSGIRTEVLTLKVSSAMAICRHIP